MARADFAPYNAVTAGAFQVLSFQAPDKTFYDLILTQACSLRIDTQGVKPGQSIRAVLRGAFAYSVQTPAYWAGNAVPAPQCSATLVDVIDILALPGSAYVVMPVALGAGLQGALPAAAAIPLAATANIPIGAASGLIADLGPAELGATYSVSPNDGRVIVSGRGLIVGTTASAAGTTIYTLTKNAPGFAPVTASIAVTVVASGGASAAPTVTTPPSLSTSSPKVGTPVTPTPGVYTGSPSVAAQWFYGDTGGLIPGAPTTSGTAYTPVSADVGHTLKYIETAVNGGGNVASAAPTTGAVTAAAAAAVTAKSTLSSSLGFIAPFLGAY